MSKHDYPWEEKTTSPDFSKIRDIGAYFDKAGIPFWRENSFLRDMDRILRERGFLSKNQVKTVQEMFEIFPLLGTGEGTKSKIALSMWRQGLSKFSYRWKRKILGNLKASSILVTNHFRLESIVIDSCILRLTNQTNHTISLESLTWKVKPIDKTKYLDASEEFYLNCSKLYLTKHNWKVRSKQFFEEEDNWNIFHCDLCDFSPFSFSFKTKRVYPFLYKKNGKNIRVTGNEVIHWDPIKKTFICRGKRISPSDGFWSPYEDEEHLSIDQWIEQYLIEDKPLPPLFGDEKPTLIKLRQPGTEESECQPGTEESESTMPITSINPPINPPITSQAEGPNSLKTAMKNVVEAASQGMKEGVKLSLVDEFQALLKNFFKDLLVKAGVPEEALSSEMGDLFLSTFSPILVIFLSEMFEEHIPANGAQHLKKGAELALTAVTYRKISGLLEDVLPQIMTLIKASQQFTSVSASAGALGPAQTTTVDELTTKKQEAAQSQPK